MPTEKGFSPLVIILIVAAVLISGAMVVNIPKDKLSPPHFGPNNQGGQGEHSNLESSKQYLKENGIDLYP